MIQEIENFLPLDIVENIDDLFNEKFPWYKTDYVVNKETDKDILFSHALFMDNKPVSPYCQQIVYPFVKKLNITKLIRAKLNLYPRTHHIVEHQPHKDGDNENMKIAIYYLNTNNGYTLIGDRMVESVKNKILIMPNIEHASTTCTSEKFRMNLNINYEN